jgi:hypothetical protein
MIATTSLHPGAEEITLQPRGDHTRTPRAPRAPSDILIEKKLGGLGDLGVLARTLFNP